MFDSLVQQSTSESIQSRAQGRGNIGIPLLMFMAAGSGLLPPWWSPYRDIALRNFWKKSDHLAGAHYNMIAKMTAIPFSAVPRDYTDTELVSQAEDETLRILDGAEFGAGWISWYSKVLEDMLGQDNGWFSEIIGPGDPAGPIIGQPITVAHMDAARCQRTGDPEYPVLYQDSNGKLWKLHYSRVMYGSQMPSANEDMFEVGYCAVSRSTMSAQNLIDISVYKMEKLGSRPHRELLITRGGLDPEDIRSAFSMTEASMDNAGLSRYSKITVAGNASMPDSDIKQVSFNTLPDSYDEKTSVTLGMAVIAMAYGVDARDLFPAMESGATRADALLAHLKQRGKGPGQIITDIESQYDRKFLPRKMKMTFDFQDDSEDEQVANIKKIRADRRAQDLKDESIDTRTAREQMISDGDLTRKQFQMLELSDGRMDNGTPVIALFHSSDPVFKKFLTIPDVANPLDITSNDPTYIKMKADEAIMKVNEELLDAKNDDQLLVFRQASAALEQLKKLYEGSKINVASADNGTPNLNPDGTPAAPRIYPTRRMNLTAPNTKVETSLNVPTADPNNITGKGMNDSISRLHQIVAEINNTISQANNRPINIIVPKEKQEAPVVNVNVPASQPQITVNVPETQPAAQPNIVVNVPKLEQPIIEVKSAPITVNTPDQPTPIINVQVPKPPRIKRTREQQVVQRDTSGKMVGTQAVLDYEYEKE